jgi:hypothetical protein
MGYTVFFRQKKVRQLLRRETFGAPEVREYLKDDDEDGNFRVLKSSVVDNTSRHA